MAIRFCNIFMGQVSRISLFRSSHPDEKFSLGLVYHSICVNPFCQADQFINPPVFRRFLLKYRLRGWP